MSRKQKYDYEFKLKPKKNIAIKSPFVEVAGFDFERWDLA